MKAIRRPRAQYTSETALMWFANPTPEGPLARVGFCSVDSMFHVVLRHSPYADKDDRYGQVRQVLSRAVRDYNDAWPGIAFENIFDGLMFSIWHPGEVDLEDMVQIVEGIPEFQGDWLRGQVADLKENAGLGREDLPFLQQALNRYERYEIRDKTVRTVRMSPYTGAWLSAKGGTLYFTPDATSDLLGRVENAIQAKDAVVRNLGVDTARGAQALRFHWAQACSNWHATKLQAWDALRSVTPEQLIVEL